MRMEREKRTRGRGFYLMVEGASIDKQAHESGADSTVWDTIKFDTQGFPTNPDRGAARVGL